MALTSTPSTLASAHDSVSESLEHTSLAGTNQFELLLFRLSTEGEVADGATVYGINVFKVREIVPIPPLSTVAGAHNHLLGLAKLREEVLPVFDLPAVLGHAPSGAYPLMIVTEYARSVQAFAVQSVEDIVRLDWDRVTPAQASGIEAGLITGIARLGDDDSQRLIQVLDVETILQRLMPEKTPATPLSVAHEGLSLPAGSVVLVADDSATARGLLEKMLHALELPFEMVNSGRAAWQRLDELASQSTEAEPVSARVPLVLTDVEMPEMDGFTLTRKIKEDPRLRGVRVLIHSSLSGTTNAAHVRRVGADGYVVKFAPDELKDAIAQALAR